MAVGDQIGFCDWNRFTMALIGYWFQLEPCAADRLTRRRAWKIVFFPFGFSPRCLRREIFDRLESKFETLSAPHFEYDMIVKRREKAKEKSKPWAIYHAARWQVKSVVRKVVIQFRTRNETPCNDASPCVELENTVSPFLKLVSRYFNFFVEKKV